MNTKKSSIIVGLGEILFDILPDGKKLPGGAPANFAYVSAQFGNHGLIASRVGNDENGDSILEHLRAKNINISQIQRDENRQTGTVKVNLQNGQPDYEITENVAWDFLDLSEQWKESAKRCDAVCFGSLAQRNSVSRNTIQDFVSLTKSDCLRIFDVNLRQTYYSKEILEDSLIQANIVKMNHEELPIVARMLKIRGQNQVETANSLLENFGLKLICVTRGGNGSLLISGIEFSEHRGVETEIANTIGAGDAFTAAMIHGVLQNLKLDEINEFANRVGAFVASKSGAMPDFKDFK